MPRFKKDPPLFGRRRRTKRQEEQGLIGILILLAVLFIIANPQVAVALALIGVVVWLLFKKN